MIVSECFLPSPCLGCNYSGSKHAQQITASVKGNCIPNNINSQGFDYYNLCFHCYSKALSYFYVFLKRYNFYVFGLYSGCIPEILELSKHFYVV